MKKKNEVKKTTPDNTEVTRYDFLICPNCGETEVGKYCPACGQSNKDFNKPIKEIVGDLFDSINLDIRLLNSLIPFFTKPGFLAEEYFKGRRKKYVPPMRMYMFFSIVFFFLAQIVGLEGITNSGNENLELTDSTMQSVFSSLSESYNDGNISLDDGVKLNFADSLVNNKTVTLDPTCTLSDCFFSTTLAFFIFAIEQIPKP